MHTDQMFPAGRPGAATAAFPFASTSPSGDGHGPACGSGLERPGIECVPLRFQAQRGIEGLINSAIPLAPERSFQVSAAFMAKAGIQHARTGHADPVAILTEIMGQR